MSDTSKCKQCHREIFRETDDMITCGGAFEVWYSVEPNGKRRMTCKGSEVHNPGNSKFIDE